jgi:hypothetical protein
MVAVEEQRIAAWGSDEMTDSIYHSRLLGNRFHIVYAGWAPRVQHIVRVVAPELPSLTCYMAIHTDVRLKYLIVTDGE